jgi:chromosome segregation ATPase
VKPKNQLIMNNQLLLEEYELNPLLSDHLHKTLEGIRVGLQKEISNKQKTIENLQEQVNLLLNVIQEKNNTIKSISKKLEVCQQTTEGNRQLFNKLLNDVDRLQQEVEWYKRTYEKRSLLGIIRDKLTIKI